MNVSTNFLLTIMRKILRSIIAQYVGGNCEKEVSLMPRGVPKRDGSGRGTRDNRGRGGCPIPQDRGVNRGKET